MKQTPMIALGILCALISFGIGFQDAENSQIASEFGEGWYHAMNALMGYAFGAALVTFFKNLGEVLKIAGAFAKWFVIASVSLMISSAYLVLQFYRIYVW